MEFVRVAISVYLGGILILAGVGKLIDTPERSLVAQMAARVPRLDRGATLAVSLVELGLGASLICGLLMPLGYLLGAGVFTSFAVVRVLHVVRPPCGCFGALTSSKGVTTSQVLTWSGLSTLLTWYATDWFWPVAVVVVVLSAAGGASLVRRSRGSTRASSSVTVITPAELA